MSVEASRNGSVRSDAMDRSHPTDHSFELGTVFNAILVDILNIIEVHHGIAQRTLTTGQIKVHTQSSRVPIWKYRASCC